MTQFKPGDAVSFAHEEHWMIGEVEEIRRGHEGDNLLIIRQGGPWSGSRYVVLSSRVEKLGEESEDAQFSRHRHDATVSIDRDPIKGYAFPEDITPFLN